MCMAFQKLPLLVKIKICMAWRKSNNLMWRTKNTNTAVTHVSRFFRPATWFPYVVLLWLPLSYYYEGALLLFCSYCMRNSFSAFCRSSVDQGIFIVPSTVLRLMRPSWVVQGLVKKSSKNKTRRPTIRASDKNHRALWQANSVTDVSSR